MPLLPTYLHSIVSLKRDLTADGVCVLFPWEGVKLGIFGKNNFLKLAPFVRIR